MGTVFRYVSDEALARHRHVDLPCPICGKVGDVFYIYADVEATDGGSDPISEACVECIRALDPEHCWEWDTERRLAGYLRAANPGADRKELRQREDAIRHELRRTPRLPHFVQDDDWPFCCGDLAEYTGEPTPDEARSLDAGGQYWERGPATPVDPASTLVPSEKLAVLGGLSAFRCPRCDRRFWTFQCT